MTFGHLPQLLCHMRVGCINMINWQAVAAKRWPSIKITVFKNEIHPRSDTHLNTWLHPTRLSVHTCYCYKPHASYMFWSKKWRVNEITLNTRSEVFTMVKFYTVILTPRNVSGYQRYGETYLHFKGKCNVCTLVAIYLVSQQGTAEYELQNKVWIWKLFWTSIYHARYQAS